MATKTEINHLHEIDKSLAVLATEFVQYRSESKEKRDEANKRIDGLEEVVGELKKVVTNGLTHKVNEIHTQMQERRKSDDSQEHEYRILGIKITQERKTAIINGLINGGFVVAAVMLSK